MTYPISSGGELDVTVLIDECGNKRFQFIVLFLCSLVMFLDGFDTQIIAYMAPMIAKEWGVSKADMGPVFSLGLAGLMVGFLTLSPLADRIGRRKVVILSTLMFGAFTLLTAFVTNTWELGLCRFLTGLGLGGATPGAVALASEYSPKRLRATGVLVIYCGFSFGFIAAGAASQLLPIYGWRVLLWIGAAAPLVTLIPLLALLPESIETLMGRSDALERVKQLLPRLSPGLDISAVTSIRKQDQQSKASPIEVLFRGKRLFGTMMIWIAFFMNLGMFYFLQSWMPTVLAELGHSASNVALVTGLTTTGGILAVLVVGPLMDRTNPYLTVATLFLGGAALVAALGASLTANLTQLMVMAFLAGCCISGGQKSGIALSALFYPLSMRSTGVGWCLGISRVGGILGPLVVGWMLQAKWPAHEIFYWGAGPMMCAGIAILMMGKVYHQNKIMLAPDSPIP